jgi:hypothetical protein
MPRIKYMTAIVFLNNQLEVMPKKYKNIRDQASSVEKFERVVCSKFPTAYYINYYLKSDGSFIKRVYL